MGILFVDELDMEITTKEISDTIDHLENPMASIIY